MLSLKRSPAVALIGGRWDESTGRRSSYISKLSVALSAQGAVTAMYNGGNFEHLTELLTGGGLQQYDFILWFADVPNHFVKHREVKKIYPKTLLVTSKRNNEEYCFLELVNRALLSKSNLCVDFRTNADRMVSARVFDPLGVVWQDYTFSIDLIASALVKRLCELRQFTRRGCTQIDVIPTQCDIDPLFLSLVKEYAETFHKLISPASGVTRFLGNSSFRCMRGFPSVRDSRTGRIFISRRDVDKRYIDDHAFVEIEAGDMVRYRGPDKPSVDAPIQVSLYEALPAINCMIHAHVYIEGAPFTGRQIPCGAVEETAEILSLISDRNTKFECINLLGHGCIAMANDPTMLRDLKYIPRPMPEYL